MTTATVEREELLQIVRDLPERKVSPALSLLHKLREEDDPYPDDPLLIGNFNEETLEACRELREGRGTTFASAEEMFASMGFADAYARSIGKIQPRR
ncbi:MAG: hypothetical protein LBJ22_07645 [Synergistaceae bacterium]|nr:hypothetical protein [Synergistaceae bacterium]